jgi:hypothetical protein
LLACLSSSTGDVFENDSAHVKMADGRLRRLSVISVAVSTAIYHLELLRLLLNYLLLNIVEGLE